MSSSFRLVPKCPHRTIVALVLAAAVCGCGSRARLPAAPSPVAGTVPIMGASRLSAPQLAAWFNSRQPRPAGVYAASVPVELLAEHYVHEGLVEGVTGDVAFVQAILETNWFRFSGTVSPSSNNFAGIGATDSNPAPASFPDPRTGVRAQIQHLRAYADATAVSCAVPPLHSPCVDPRFDLVVPKGKAPRWNQMGNGNWATASTYGGSIVALFSEALSFNGQR
jgi:hypothetical protein